MKHAFFLSFAALLSACGTVNTLTKSDDEISSSLTGNDTYCEFLPRVYGGTAYDVCLLRSNPDTKYSPTGPLSGPVVPFYLADTVASAVSDTLVLPYSLYAQIRYGSVEIR